MEVNLCIGEKIEYKYYKMHIPYTINQHISTHSRPYWCTSYDIKIRRDNGFSLLGPIPLGRYPGPMPAIVKKQGIPRPSLVHHSDQCGPCGPNLGTVGFTGEPRATVSTSMWLGSGADRGTSTWVQLHLSIRGTLPKPIWKFWVHPKRSIKIMGALSRST